MHLCAYGSPDDEQEPCYGEIRPVVHRQREGNGYIQDTFEHACEGHRHGGLYVEEGSDGGSDV